MIKPIDHKLNVLKTLTVTHSRLVARPGSTALALTTREAGTIAFEVNLVAIHAIRISLDLAEAQLRALPGNSQEQPS
jgi:hypothetical protein